MILRSHFENILSFFLFEADYARAADGCRRCEFQVAAIDKKLYFVRDIHNLSRGQTKTSTIIQHAVQILNPFRKDNALQYDKHSVRRWKADKLSYLFGQITVSEFAGGGIGLAVNLLHGKCVDMNMLNFILFAHILEAG